MARCRCPDACGGFTIPGALGDNATLTWALVSYALFSLAYSFVNIPYARSPLHDPGARERARLSSSRVVAASLTILLIAVVVSPQIERAEDLQRSLTMTTAALAAVAFVLYIVCFATTREAVQRRAERASIRETLNMLRSNRPLILLCASSVLFLTGMFSLSTVAVYYARDVLGNADL